MEWISVNDRLPKNEECVLVYFPKWRKRDYSCVFSAEYQNGEDDICDKGFWNDYCRFNIGGEDGITHWMPLPNPPKEVNIENETVD